MTWETIALDLPPGGNGLLRQIDALFEQQRKNWKALRDGEQALAGMTSKAFARGSEKIIVQANPGRRKSTYAKVDPNSVARRPCFLCPENIPPQERGLAFEDLVILPNPCPVVPRHCTIPSREHRPQLLGRQIPQMLRLARALGPEMLVFYNGPRCGASAPDHFHFQAGNTCAVPLFSHLPESNRVQAISSFMRKILVYHDRTLEKASRHVRQVLEAWSSMSPDDDEPLVSVLSLFREGRYLTAIFPRAKHRPKCFYAQDDSRIAISPAALEMAGILVVAEPGHLDKIDQQTIISIYEEVSLDRERFTELVRVLT